MSICPLAFVYSTLSAFSSIVVVNKFANRKWSERLFWLAISVRCETRSRSHASHKIRKTMFLLLFLVGAITALFAWVKWNYGHWERKKLPGPQPTMLVGNVGSTLNFGEHAAVLYERWYRLANWNCFTYLDVCSCALGIYLLIWFHFHREYVNVPYIGYYKILTPGLVLRDPDIIKDVLIKNHYNFHRNDFKMSEKADPIMATNPFFCVDEEWRHSRKTIAPAFSPNRV